MVLSSDVPAESDQARSIVGRPVVVATAIAGLVLAAYVGVGSLLVYATEALLVLFTAVLYGVFLRGTGQLLAKGLPGGAKTGVAVSTGLQLLLAAGTLVLFATQIRDQVESAVQNIDRAKASVGEKLAEYPRVATTLKSDPLASQLITLPDGPSQSGRGMSGGNPDDSDGAKSQQNASASTRQQDEASRSDGESGESSGESESSTAAAGVFRSVGDDAAAAAKTLVTTSLGVVANALIIFFVGLYLALDPEIYRRGLLKLLRPGRRQRGREVLDEIGQTLWRWLLGRMATMALTGVGVGIVLWLIGVPMPVTLGIVTGLCTFIPNIGPVIALVLAVLVAFPEGLTTVGLTVSGYVLFQLIESYLLTPLIQKKQVDMPPALILTAQLLMGVLCGFLGIAVATPLVAVAMVVTGMLYVEDRLGEDRTLDDLPGIDRPTERRRHESESTDDAASYRRWQEAAAN